MASKDYGFFIDGDDGEHTKEATPFLLVKVKPSMMIWDDQAAIKETVESLNGLGVRHWTSQVSLSRRCDQRADRTFWCPSNKKDSASAGMVENAITHVKENVRAWVIATRELHGVVMDPNHVTLAWCVRFAGQIISRTVKGSDGLTAFQRAFQRASHPRAMPSAWREKDLVLRSEQEKYPDHGQVLGRYLLGHHCGNTCWLCGLQNYQKAAS